MDICWLTLVTITKDDPDGLARTVSSAAALRAAGAEHIVIDGSAVPADGRKLVAQAGAGLRVQQRSPQGIADAFNVGLASARGEWVWFLNGGDAIHENLDPEWLLILLKNTQAEIVTGALHYDGEALPRIAPPLPMQWPLTVSWLPHPATLVRRRILVENGGFETRWKICMDFDLWYRLLSGPNRVDVVAVPLARFDATGISMRAEHRALLAKENVAVLWKHKWVIWRTGWQQVWRVLYVFLYAAKKRWR